MKKKLLALLMTIAMLFSMLPSASFAEEVATIPQPTQTVSATEEPVPAEQPTEEEKPTESATPAPAEEPVSTETPSATEVPATTEEPVLTEEPVSTEEPVGTEEPVSTEESASITTYGIGDPNGMKDPNNQNNLVPSESYFHESDTFGYDSITQNSSTDLTGIVSVQVGNTVLSRNSATSTTGNAYENGITISFKPGYYLYQYKIVCGDKYGCQTEAQGNAVKASDVMDGATAASITVNPEKAAYGHSSKKAPYWILLQAKQDTTKYTVTYDWGELDGQLSASVPAKEEYLVNEIVTVKAPSDEALNEAKGKGYTFEGWKISIESNKSIYYANEKFGMPQNNVTLTAQWKKIETTSFTVTKVWDDNNNQDGIRPKSVAVQLYQNDEVYGDSVTLKANENDEWAYTWTGLPTDDDGTYTYRVEEVNVPDGYTAKVEGATITNSHTPSTVEKTVTKVWDDNDNQDGIRPESIEVQLYADSEPVGDPVTVTAEEGWEYTWENLPEFANGVEIEYSVEEVTKLSDYTVEYDGMTIINNHTIEMTSKTVTKVWNDDSNRDGIRPDSVTVQLLANGVVIDEINLSAENEWKHTWTELNKNENGKEINYTVEEIEVKGYTATIDGNKITNSHTPELYNGNGKFTVTKIWDDDNNRDGIRPDSITVTLLADGQACGTAELSAANNWTYTWEELYKYESGKEINYTVEEVEVKGYTTSIVGGTITNSHDPEHFGDKDGFVTIRKEWNDKDNQDGKRSESIVVYLQADGVTVRTATLSATNQWTAKFDNLLKYRDGGKEIVYTIVEEVAEDSAYTPSYAFDTTNFVFTVTNTYSPETTSKTVTKKWADDDNRDAKRPESITVQLMADGKAYGEAVTLTAEDNWEYTWSNLPKYNNGKLIDYSIKENAVADYTAEVVVGVDGQFVLTNTHKIAMTSKTVTKVWNDDNNRDGIRPSSVTVQLMADGKAYGEAITLNADNNWSYSWTDLPVNNTGKAITYSIVETNVADGYTANVAEKDGTFILTNSHKIDSISKTVTKVWNDDNNRDALRPSSVTVQLMADGKAYGETITLKADNNWSYSWTDLPVNNSGKAITYSIVETNVADGYTADVAEKDGMFILTNSHKIDFTSKTVTKVWNDDNNRDGIRPDSITVQLFANGVAQGEAVQLTKESNWSYTWNNLPTKNNGKEIVYTVDETAVDGYTKSIEGMTITNTHIAATTSISTKKVWNDQDDFDGLRPTEVKVQLMANGEAYGEPIVLNEKNEWSYSWSDLNVFADGKVIEYSVQEVEVADGYTASYETAEDGTLLIVNTHAANPVTKTVTKVWNDSDDKPGERPDSIKVQLYANGKAYGDVVEVTAKDGWVYTWESLPSLSEGKEIVYTVKEVDVPSGYAASYSDDTFTITNIYRGIPKTGEDNVNPIWFALALMSLLTIEIVLHVDKKRRHC